MGSLWRSQEMMLAQLFLQSEACYETVSALGELGLVQFRDLNPEVNAFQRRFVNEVRRCEEMERKLRFFEKEINKAQLRLSNGDEAAHLPAPGTSEMQAMEAEFEQLERDMKEINTNEETLRSQQLELTELSAILNKTGQFFAEAEHSQALQHNQQEHEDRPLLSVSDDRPSQLGFVSGVISRDRMAGFELLLWRACRGNVFLRRVPIDSPLEDPVSGKPILKDVFIIFFQGGQLEARVTKICEGYEATLYPCPSSPVERRELSVGVGTRIRDLEMVLGHTTDHRNKVLGKVARDLQSWFIRVRKIKAIYVTMNMFNIDVTRKCLIAECWCPTKRLDDIHRTLLAGTERSGSSVPAILNRVPTKEAPPTYHVTNKFTSGFQAIVDAYGVASYREVNPGPFTIITFPFLFAVMFGDCGHGLLMALAAFALIYNERSLMNFKAGGEIWDTMFGGRYIIFLMGLFSIYTGLIYNDCFSKSLSIFNTGWKLGEFKDIPPNTDLVDLKPYGEGNDFSHPYPVGLDPVWMLSDNKLLFTNSFKMKLSVLLGVIHMLFGVVLSYFNHRHFKKELNIIFEFIPQVLFLTCIFGYLCIMIIFKWLTPIDDFPNKSAPSLLLMLINMFLQFGANPETDQVLYGSKDGAIQGKVQMALVVVAVLCVPVMLLPKPFILKARHKAKLAARGRLPSHYRRDTTESSSSLNSDPGEVLVPSNSDDSSEGGGHGEGDEFVFSEVMVHQAIHTIEFCLGCISNTASYLRLWALSLAHGQLSEVLWSMVLHNGFSNAAMLFCAFAVWAVLTVAILLIMEGLSAFLHALRLHWVEFQNKFYDGNGYQFAPFSFKHAIAGTEEN
eukprot:m.264043 g.264043  ORF g.264043 m.264043 type:complete len:844 (-) comp27441_c0_seq1:71-2602(-)